MDDRNLKLVSLLLCQVSLIDAVQIDTELVGKHIAYYRIITIAPMSHSYIGKCSRAQIRIICRV